MNLTASFEYIIPAISALEMTLQELGADIEPGKAVAEAQAVFEKGEV